MISDLFRVLNLGSGAEKESDATGEDESGAGVLRKNVHGDMYDEGPRRDPAPFVPFQTPAMLSRSRLHVGEGDGLREKFDQTSAYVQGRHTDHPN